MTSELKSETARINGAKSRGPVTPEGRDKSARNAVKHGFSSHSHILLACEDPEEFDGMFKHYRDLHEPETPAERELVETMASARWRIRRLETIETGLMDDEMSRLDPAAPAPAGSPVQMARAFRALTAESNPIALAGRYQARLQRLHDKNYKTLRDLKRARFALQPHEVQATWVDPEHNRARDAAILTLLSMAARPVEIPNEPTGDAIKEVSIEPATEEAGHPVIEPEI
jgi:hypothetical protein